MSAARARRAAVTWSSKPAPLAMRLKVCLVAGLWADVEQRQAELAEPLVAHCSLLAFRFIAVA